MPRRRKRGSTAILLTWISPPAKAQKTYPTSFPSEARTTRLNRWASPTSEAKNSLFQGMGKEIRSSSATASRSVVRTSLTVSDSARALIRAPPDRNARWRTGGGRRPAIPAPLRERAGRARPRPGREGARPTRRRLPERRRDRPRRTRSPGEAALPEATGLRSGGVAGGLLRAGPRGGNRRPAGHGIASEAASKVGIGTSRAPAARARPREKASEERSPVKEPGPETTAIRSRPRGTRPTLASTEATAGASASAPSRGSSTVRGAPSSSTTARDGLGVAVSMARSLIGVLAMLASPPFRCGQPRCSSSTGR